MGLSDKYQTPPVSVSDYGFTHDDATTWPGVAVAEEEFKRRTEQSDARAEGTRRSLLRDRYRAQMELSRKLRFATGSDVRKMDTAAGESSLPHRRSEEGRVKERSSQ
jgi:hypothetical protein